MEDDEERTMTVEAESNLYLFGRKFSNWSRPQA